MDIFFKKYDLNFEKTLPYFINHIECGPTLSSKAIERIDFKRGSFFTILSSNAFLERLHQFDSCEIMPRISKEQQKYRIMDTPEGQFTRRVRGSLKEGTALVATFLQENLFNYAIIEHAVLKTSDPHKEVKNVKMVPYETEVYYALNYKNTEDEIYNTIVKSEQLWHFLAVLTHLKNIKDHLDKNDLDKICDNSKFVMISAYDGDGYLYWEKTL